MTFGYAYEGPPTCAHGGVIAELFDELLGSSAIIMNQAGMTGTLKVIYRQPTPLMVELDLVARLTGREGRKIFAWGGIYHQGVLTAEAEGIFIGAGQASTSSARRKRRPGVIDPGSSSSSLNAIDGLAQPRAQGWPRERDVRHGQVLFQMDQ